MLHLCASVQVHVLCLFHVLLNFIMLYSFKISLNKDEEFNNKVFENTERDTHIPTQKKNENKDYSEYTEV